VVVRCGNEARRAVARWRDIYAITAPIVVEATQRVANLRAKVTGVAPGGEIFDARDFLSSLSPRHLTADFD